MNCKKSGTDIVISYLNKLSPEAIFTINELRQNLNDVSYTDIRSIVTGLNKKNKIIRVCRGVYCLPSNDMDLEYFPSTEKILESISKQGNFRYCPIGSYARYVLGLEKVIPKDILCYSTGKVKTLNLENGTCIKLLPSKKKILLSSNNQKTITAQMYVNNVGKGNLSMEEKTIISKFINNI